MEGLEQRIKRLARANRRMKQITTGTLLTVAAIILMGQVTPKTPNVIQATKFVLKDATGKIGGEFAMTPEGAVTFAMFGKDGKTRFEQFLAVDGSVGIALYSKHQNNIIEIAVSGDDLPHVYVSDAEGRRRFSLVADNTGTALGLVDSSMKVRAMIQTKSDGSPSLYLSDKDGKDRVLVELQPNGDPRMLFIDQYGRRRAVLGLDKGTPGIFLTDEQGKVVWGEIGSR